MYAVRRRLGEQKLFLLYTGGKCLLFVKGGVHVKNVESVDASRFSPFLWAFIDADGHLDGVPAKLLDRTNLFIIFTTSPKSLRWKSLSKLTDHAVVVMNAWYKGEILLA
jgi:hypothetical protein